MTDVFLVAPCRTAIGRVGGALAEVRPDDLAAHVVAATADRAGIDLADVDDVYWGAANQAGEDNRNVARMAALLAGAPVTVPGATVNRLCGSGMEAVIAAARAVRAGDADLCIAGGSESMTRAPFALPRADRSFPRSQEVHDTRLGWRMVNPRLAAEYPPISLGATAERVAERCGVTRERQDRFALASHRAAAAAVAAGRFDDEIVPLDLDGQTITVDECIRAQASLDALEGLAPVFVDGGTVTAGNSSPMNDGAAAMVVCSADVARGLDTQPLGRYVGSAVAGVHPDLMGLGPVPATGQALHRAGWLVDDIDLIEVNEAFAAQAVAVIDELGLDPERVNVNGGAIALGHPLGASGARIITTALHELRRRGGRRAAATMCVGVGQGVTALIEAA